MESLRPKGWWGVGGVATVGTGGAREGEGWIFSYQ